MFGLSWTGIKWIAVGAAVISTFLYIRYLQHARDYYRDKRDEIQATLNQERISHKQAMDAAEEKRKRDLDNAQRLRNENVEHLQERLHANASRADALAARLRVVEANRLRPLAPAASAPAECRDYESDPTRLSGAHRGFLIGEAAAAADNVDLLEACRRDYEIVKVACGITSQ